MLAFSIGPRQAYLSYLSPMWAAKVQDLRSLARTSPARSYKQWVKKNFQTESQIPGPSEWLSMRS